MYGVDARAHLMAAAVEMKMLGMKQDQQRTIRVSANDILEWMELHGHTVSSDSTMVFGRRATTDLKFPFSPIWFSRHNYPRCSHGFTIMHGGA